MWNPHYQDRVRVLFSGKLHMLKLFQFLRYRLIANSPLLIWWTRFLMPRLETQRLILVHRSLRLTIWCIIYMN